MSFGVVFMSDIGIVGTYAVAVGFEGYTRRLLLPFIEDCRQRKTLATAFPRRQPGLFSMEESIFSYHGGIIFLSRDHTRMIAYPQSN
jgi:hypothetical protein